MKIILIYYILRDNIVTRVANLIIRLIDSKRIREFINIVILR